MRDIAEIPPHKLFICRFLLSQLFVGLNTLVIWESGGDANVVERRGEQRRGGKDGAESLEEEENRESGHSFMMCGKGK